MKRKIKKLLALLLIVALTFTLSGCFDLGDYGEVPEGVSESDYSEYYKSYYEAFGTVDMCPQNKILNKYSLEDSFFSKSTVDDLTWEKSEYAVAYDEYVYMAIEVEKDMTIDELALYMKGNTGVVSQTMYIYMYILDKESFSNLPTLDQSLYELDNEGHYKLDENGEKKRITFDFPDKTTACGETTILLSENKFTSFTIKSFNNYQDDIINVSKGSYIMLSFYNNTAYGKELNYGSISFTALDLLIRATVD